jgi:hypothetical protein
MCFKLSTRKKYVVNIPRIIAKNQRGRLTNSKINPTGENATNRVIAIMMAEATVNKLLGLDS